MNRTASLLSLAIASAALAGCATAPKPLRGEFAPLAPQQASAAEAVGDSVRWGGRIVTVTPADSSTCFEILGRDLSDSARPTRIDTDVSNGRFLACRDGFYDPAIFTADRDVTVTGRIAGYETRPIGEYDYRYPRVAADVIYLWPERRPEDYYQTYQSPFWPMYRPWGFWGGHYVPMRVPYRAAPAPRPAPSNEK